MLYALYSTMLCLYFGTYMYIAVSLCFPLTLKYFCKARVKHYATRILMHKENVLFCSTLRQALNLVQPVSEMAPYSL